MYGAVPYVMKAFGVDRSTAFTAVCEWVDRQEADALEGNGAGERRKPRKPRRRS